MVWLHAPLAIIPGIYAKYYGLSLITIASVVFFGRVFDAVTDPLIGFCSDRYRRQTGTRKPFVLVGGLLMIVSGYFLYVPLSTSVVYFSGCLFAFYFSYTLFDIPHNAWASELAPTSTAKSTIYSFRSVAVYIGSALFYVIPLLPFFETRDITPQTLQVSIMTSGFFMLIFLIVCMRYASDGKLPITSSNLVQKITFNMLVVNKDRSIFSTVIGNKALCIF